MDNNEINLAELFEKARNVSTLISYEETKESFINSTVKQISNKPSNSKSIAKFLTKYKTKIMIPITLITSIAIVSILVQEPNAKIENHTEFELNRPSLKKEKTLETEPELENKTIKISQEKTKDQISDVEKTNESVSVVLEKEEQHLVNKVLTDDIDIVVETIIKKQNKGGLEPEVFREKSNLEPLYEFEHFVRNKLGQVILQQPANLFLSKLKDFHKVQYNITKHITNSELKVIQQKAKAAGINMRYCLKTKRKGEVRFLFISMIKQDDSNKMDRPFYYFKPRGANIHLELVWYENQAGNATHVPSLSKGL